MQRPFEIAYRNTDHSATIDSLVHEKERELGHLCDKITACQVSIETARRGRRAENRLRVRIKLSVPGGQLASVADAPQRQGAGHDACAALLHAFEDIQRQLEDYVTRARRLAGEPPVLREGRISELFLEMNYGKIAASDGGEVYFHRNTVLDDAFEKLETGTAVKFIDEPGLLGRQATTVKVVVGGGKPAPGRSRHH